ISRHPTADPPSVLYSVVPFTGSAGGLPVLRFRLALVAVVLAAPCSAADPPAVADLVRQLEAGSPGERVIAAEQLGDLGPAAAEAVPALVRAIHSCKLPAQSDAETRRAAGFLFQACV